MPPFSPLYGPAVPLPVCLPQSSVVHLQTTLNSLLCLLLSCDVNLTSRLPAIPNMLRTTSLLSCKPPSYLQEKARQAISWPEAAGAARREILFLHHMLAAHEASLDQLEAEGERRHLSERARRTEFVTNAREALGLS